MQISAEQLYELIMDAKSQGWQEGYKYARDKNNKIIQEVEQTVQAPEKITDDHGSYSDRRAVPRSSYNQDGAL